MSTSVAPADMVIAGVAGVKADQASYDTADNYLNGVHADPYKPSSATDEYKRLAARAITNFMPLAVSTPAQALAIEGYRKSGADPNATVPEWDAWQSARMDGRQSAVFRAALAYGQSWIIVLPDPVTGQPAFHCVSPRRVYASYADPVSDEYPLWVLWLDDALADGKASTGRLLTQTQVIPVSIGGEGGTVFGSPVAHGTPGICPAVRFAPDVDLEGRVTGVITPLIPSQDRINQGVFDRLIVQTFGSFKVRTITGMAPNYQRDENGELLRDDNGNPIPVPIPLSASRFAIAPDPNTKFGTLDETPIDGYLALTDADVREFSVLSRVPPHYLLGSLVNLSAEALAAAEAALSRWVDELKHIFGEAAESVLRLASIIMGVEPDPKAQVIWKDAESRSLAATVDALGKAVQMLNVPARALWTRIPGVTATDAETWAQMAADDDPGRQLAENLLRDGGTTDATAGQ